MRTLARKTHGVLDYGLIGDCGTNPAVTLIDPHLKRGTPYHNL
jgi:hypothetical protein